MRLSRLRQQSRKTSTASVGDEPAGLHIIGTERHESRRIDNQLRGRSGRQGDPGSSRFYLSLEDNLMRIFASDRMSMLMQRFGMKEDEAIEAGMLNRAIENAQRKVEAHNFDVRKHLLDYDDVANDQRRVVYTQRNELMEAEEIHDTVVEMRHDVFEDVVNRYVPPGSIDEQWEIPSLEQVLEGEFGIEVPVGEWLEKDENIHEEVLRERILEEVDKHFDAKAEMTGPEVMHHFEKALMLNVLDQKWKDHLANMDYLRQGIGLRGYAQKQPMQEYKRESYEMFTALLDNIKHEVIRILARVQVKAEEDVEAVEALFEAHTPAPVGTIPLNAEGRAALVAANSGLGLAFVFALTGFMGYTLGPILNVYTALPNGNQLVMTALGATGVIFLSLSGYALTSRRDFSFMGAFLMVGILVAFLAGLAAMFFSMPGLSLAVSAMFVLLMSGLILYETSQIIHGGESNYIMATVTLYVSIYNLFLSLLHLLGAFSGED